MAHKIYDPIVTLANGNTVHFNSEKSATDYQRENEGSTYELMVKTSACYKSTRGYCGLCWSFEKHPGQPNYTETHDAEAWWRQES